MNLPSASMTVSSEVSGRIEPSAGPTWVILFPSTTMSVLASGSRPDPSTNVPFLISNRGELAIEHLLGGARTPVSPVLSGRDQVSPTPFEDLAPAHRRSMSSEYNAFTSIAWLSDYRVLAASDMPMIEPILVGVSQGGVARGIGRVLNEACDGGEPRMAGLTLRQIPPEGIDQGIHARQDHSERCIRRR